VLFRSLVGKQFSEIAVDALEEVARRGPGGVARGLESYWPARMPG